MRSGHIFHHVLGVCILSWLRGIFSCGNNQVYMPWVRRAALLYDIRHVFLATDGGDEIYEQTKAYPGLRWHFLRQESAFEDVMIDSLVFHDTAGNPDAKSVEDRGFRLGVDAMVDMLLLSHANVLVGKFSSNVFRAALEVGSARAGELKPYVSLDATWCWDFGVNSGHILRGPYKGYADFPC
eukprot:m.367378 g.367378  ORF g.367378 m.367378 type:complete len:182 (+) comp20832_c0_seq2:1466-2011(+)